MKTSFSLLRRPASAHQPRLNLNPLDCGAFQESAEFCPCHHRRAPACREPRVPVFLTSPAQPFVVALSRWVE